MSKRKTKASRAERKAQTALCRFALGSGLWSEYLALIDSRRSADKLKHTLHRKLLDSADARILH